MKIASKTLVIRQDNIDTDQIIPARFLTTTSREGLGQHAFADWRYKGGEKTDSILNSDHGCTVLVAGTNFGCGSSREHAPWALTDYGFKAVISSQIADIFRGNALKNGLVPIEVSPEQHRYLLEHPGTQVNIDVAEASIELDNGETWRFELDPFSRHCLVQGVDQLGYLLNLDRQIRRFEEGRP
ncbi:3-isopropylmalate dehydratase small subunit [Gallaecimonas kandeliae]|uniref:3-isopropylmalate dehydratase small subunit n=1 Tax=Gallaecimonas kandeliae TaxID=3029055 RepID=UPI0026472ECA|nr:3-isopropylmalate dehydratase small subunit [Gallaecimonas kandeliae]WKE66673.1 3-isopropylmalate dehydratase small subunit [Gallaecimonas kandeliae]